MASTKIQIKKIKVDITKLVTMAEMGLGVVRPLKKNAVGLPNLKKKEYGIQY